MKYILAFFVTFIATAQQTDFVLLKGLSSDFVFDMKYATPDNFLKQAVYECGECYLRKKTAEALVKANEEFKTLGYRIKLFDCYRPLEAVDLTLVDKDGKELDMGTPFDFFGEKAHHTCTTLPKKVLENRKLLKDILNKYNFKSIYSEWWHYEYRPEMQSKVENFQWQCE